MDQRNPLEIAHILIVDGNPFTRQVFHEALIHGEHRVSLASSGEEALAYLHLITPDLLLINLELAGIDGREVTRRVKADTRKPFMPVIILSTDTSQASTIQSLDAGADDVMHTPITTDELLAHVRAMLRFQRSQRSLRNEQRKTELLLHLVRELGTSIDLDVLLTRFLNNLADAVGAVRASIILPQEADTNHAICYSSTHQQSTRTLNDILRSGAAGWVMRERRTLVIDDTREDQRWVTNPNYETSVRSVMAMPIMREGQIFGVITLVHHTPSYFTDDHLDLLSSVAAQCAVALESARLFSLVSRQKELLTRRADEMLKISEINTHISELMYPDQLVRLVAYMVQQQFGYPFVCVLLRQGDELILNAAAGNMGDATLGEVRFPVTQGLNGWVVQNRQWVRVDDVRADERFALLLPNDALVRSELVVPILLRREVLGTIDVRSTEVAAFGPSDEAIVHAIASQLSIALGNALLLENEQRRIRQLSQVNRLSVAITAQLDTNESLQLAADSVAAIFGVQQVGLLVISDTDDPLNLLIALHGIAPSHETELVRVLLDGDDVTARIQGLRESCLIRNVQQHTAVGALRGFFNICAITSLLVVPLLAGTQTLGVMCIDATSREEGFGRADLELATTLASLVLQVIENTRLYRVVEDERSTLNAVLSGAADPILLIGANDEVLLANRAAEERLGIKLGEAYGKSLHNLLNGPNPTPLAGLLPLLQTKGNGTPTELALTPDITYSVSISPVRGADGEPLGRVAVLQDISAIKMLERQERQRVRTVFQRYVSHVVAERLLSEGQEFGQPTECDVAVLFADLRGFTSLTERMHPRILIERILNRYFTAMTEVLHRHEGTVDKFLGDGLIGVFGTPIARPDDPQRALLTAVDMQRAFSVLNTSWRNELGLDIGLGIGISYGRAVVGNIGSEQRLDYTIIGDVVNTASRLSGIASAGQIIISFHLHDALPASWNGTLTLNALGRVQLKGKQEPHLIYEVLVD